MEQKTLWSTRVGKSIYPYQMSTAHICNSIAWLSCDSDMTDVKDGISVREWLIIFANELKERAK